MLYFNIILNICSLLALVSKHAKSLILKHCTYTYTIYIIIKSDAET